MNILTIGGATQDIFIKHKHHQHEHTHERTLLVLEEGTKIDVDDIHYCSGGGATNTAASFARLGYSTTSFFKVGDDPQGTFILNQLQSYGINTSYALQEKGGKTSVSLIMGSPNGERTALVYRGASSSITPQEFPYNALSSCSAVYITSLHNQALHLMTPLAQEAQRRNALVAMNPGTEQLKAGASFMVEALPYVDIFMVNRSEAILFMQSLGHTQAFSLPLFFSIMFNYGPRTLVVTDGANGVHVATKDHQFYHPSIATSVVSTLGAGDAFGSCFVASILQGDTLEDSIRAGLINSASVVQYPDAKMGLLTQDELMTQRAKLDKKLLQKIS